MIRMNKRQALLLILTLMFLVFLACSAPWLVANDPPPVSMSIAQPIAYQVPADATTTPTPFQPLPPTATYFPTDIPPTPTLLPSVTSTSIPTPPTPVPTPRKPTKFPKPNQWAPIAIPPPVGLLPQPEGQINILLLGSDQRRWSSGFRTDTILLVTINPQDGSANITSFPRDLYVYIPGWTMQRINTAHAHGGFETTALTFEYNFGVRPDHYVLINFWSFVRLIDNLGGIDVKVASSVSDYRDHHGWYTINPGKHHMDGELALWYVRTRKTTSDFERTQRQQEVIQGLFNKLISLDAIQRVPELYKTYKESVITDLKLMDLLSLLPLAARVVETKEINHFFIGRPQVNGWVTPDGAQVLLPKREAVLEVMRKALNSAKE